MQGQLRNEFSSAVIDTQCAHCAKLIHIEVNSDLKYRVQEEGATPYVLLPFYNIFSTHVEFL